MTYFETKTLLTTGNNAYEISEEVDTVIRQSGIQQGIVVVEIPHSTAGIVATTGLPEVLTDLDEEINRIVPARTDYHHEDSPTDSSGHIKCALFGNSICSIIQKGKRVSEGKLHFYLMEYDGPRHRKYMVGVFGE